jgi:glycosyltransferase involved in cell wall biosynthesis
MSSAASYAEAKSNAELPPCVSVVIAAFNEAGTAGQLLRQVLAQRPVQQVIVVDDGSTDDTRKVLGETAASDARVLLLWHERNRGKGAALRTAYGHATAPIVLVQDADLEYDPAEYYLLLKPILTDKADVVYGSRFQGAGAHRVLYYWHSVGNRIVTTFSNMLTNLNLSDIETCFKVFRREVLQKITVEEDGFGVEAEVTAKVSRLKARIYEVPISYYGRTYAEGKKIDWRDGLGAVWCVLKYNLLR